MLADHEYFLHSSEYQCFRVTDWEYTDLTLPKPRREFQKKVLNTAGKSFGIAFLGKQKRHDQSIFSNKILIFDSVTNVNVLYGSHLLYSARTLVNSFSFVSTYFLVNILYIN